VKATGANRSNRETLSLFQLMSGNKLIERDLAIKRGLEFIYRTACDPENFALYGHDYLGCFSCIASTSRDPGLRRQAARMGRERARRWRKKHATISADCEADDIACLVIGSHAADQLGVFDKAFKREIQRVSCEFTARDYFGFDPETEQPPQDIPDTCECGADHERGRKRCRQCKKALAMLSRYAVWLDALIFTYTGDRLGVKLGTTYPAVLKWLPTMRPYATSATTDDDDSNWAVYAVTHVVYTLNDYSCYQLSPLWLPQEYEFLKANLEKAIATEDPESLGEFMDALKSFGLTDGHPLIRKGIEYLLSSQNEDGSWGDLDAEDIYQRYHPTWTAIDGLREYAWRGERLSFQRLKPFLLRCAKK
jgi:hypothetical protein